MVTSCNAFKLATGGDLLKVGTAEDQRTSLRYANAILSRDASRPYASLAGSF
jgi:hypothetical protein